MAALATSILGGSALDGVAKIINAIKGKNPEDAEKIQELLEKHEEAVLTAAYEQRQLDVQEAQQQADINKTEAASTNWFVASWRPAVGWVCCAALCSEFLVRPFVLYIAGMMGKVTVYPTLDMGDLMTLLFGLLGLGTMRTAEKLNGINSGH